MSRLLELDFRRKSLRFLRNYDKKRRKFPIPGNDEETRKSFWLKGNY